MIQIISLHWLERRIWNRFQINDESGWEVLWVLVVEGALGLLPTWFGGELEISDITHE